MHSLVALVLWLYQYVLAVPVDNPSKWPGHLEPFGSKQKTVPVEQIYYWPSAADFFKSYVDKSRPVLLKGVYKYSKARQWNDQTLRGNEEEKDEEVFVERALKENRTNPGRSMRLREFADTYRKEPLFLFSTVPRRLMPDLLLPPPLTCNETSKHLVNVNAVISQGGSKSTVHNEDVETIYCAIQGTVETLLIEYTKNKDYVIDRPQGGYSTMDVDRVDYTKYPNLRNVDEYLKATVDEGDCLYLPYRWYKQQNSFANHEGRNVAMNVWFKHLHDHYPQDCTMNVNEATLDKFEYLDLKEQNMIENSEKQIKFVDYGDGEDDEDNVRGDILNHFKLYVRIVKGTNITFNRFYRLIKTDEMLSQKSHENLEFPKSFKLLAFQLFRRLDTNNDTIITKEDFVIADEKKLRKLEAFLEYQTARIEDYVEDLVESKHHNEPLHEFDRRMTEKIRSQRPFDEL